MLYWLIAKDLVVIATLKPLSVVTPVKHTCSGFDKRGHRAELQLHHKHSD